MILASSVVVPSQSDASVRSAKSSSSSFSSSSSSPQLSCSSSPSAPSSVCSSPPPPPSLSPPSSGPPTRGAEATAAAQQAGRVTRSKNEIFSLSNRLQTTIYSGPTNSSPCSLPERRRSSSSSPPLPSTITPPLRTMAITATSCQSSPEQSGSVGPLDLDAQLAASANLELRLRPGEDTILGEGQQGTVYLCTFRQSSFSPPNTASPSSSSSPCSSSSSSSKWRICAGKVFGDPNAGLHESTVYQTLRRASSASSHPGRSSILGYYGLKLLRDCLPEWSEQEPRRRSRMADFDGSSLVIVVKYCMVGDLHGYIQSLVKSHTKTRDDYSRCHSREMPATTPETRKSIDRSRWFDWALQLTNVLEFCKRSNVLVGDLKPQNILLTNELKIKLADFDRAKIISPKEYVTQTKTTGTTLYSAPELLRLSVVRYSYPIDVFACGITLYYMLTGTEPFEDIKNPIERILMASKGRFWEYEYRHRFELANSRSRSSYSDGSPTIPFLNDPESTVDQEVVDLLKKMCAPSDLDRFAIEEVTLELARIKQNKV